MHPAPLSLIKQMREQHARRSSSYASAPMWRGTALATNFDGQEEAFSIGLDGYVWSYAIYADSGRTGRLISTGLSANTFATGKLPNGHTLVISADGTTVQYVVESDSPGQRWALPCPVTFQADHTRVVGIDKLFTQTLGDHLFVGILARHSGVDGQDLHQFWEAIWTGDGLIFTHSPLKFQRQKTSLS